MNKIDMVLSLNSGTYWRGLVGLQRGTLVKDVKSISGILTGSGGGVGFSECFSKLVVKMRRLVKGKW